MKLDQEPRLAGEKPAIVDWARRVVQAVNPLVDSSGTQASQIAALQADTRGPAFYASLSADESVGAGTFTFLHCDVEDFDTDGCYNPATWTFTPNKAGIYLFTVNICPNVSAGTMTDIRAQFWKNGASVRQPILFQGSSGTVGNFSASTPIAMNGTTDSVQVVASINGTGIASPKFLSGASLTSFSGFLARPTP